MNPFQSIIPIYVFNEHLQFHNFLEIEIQKSRTAGRIPNFWRKQFSTAHLWSKAARLRKIYSYFALKNPFHQRTDKSKCKNAGKWWRVWNWNISSKYQFKQPKIILVKIKNNSNKTYAILFLILSKYSRKKQEETQIWISFWVNGETINYVIRDILMEGFHLFCFYFKVSC